MLRNMKYGSFSAAAVNEDAFGAYPDCAWVLDGSTGLSGQHHIPQAGSDAQWYASAFSDYLSAVLPCSDLPLRRLFSDGVRKVWQAFHSISGDIGEPYDIPCCLGAAIRQRGSFLEYILIGDCSLLIRFRDGTVRELFDGNLGLLDENTLRVMQRISAEKGLPLSECRQEILPELRRVRSLMNTDGGYLSLSDKPDSVLHAPVGCFPSEDVRDLCLISDGFSQYYRSFQLCSGPEAFLEQARLQTPDALYRQLLDAQYADSELSLHPRFKLSDDATIVYAEVDEQQ